MSWYSSSSSDREALALDLADLVVPGGDAGGQRHLVAVVDHLAGLLEPLVRLHERQQLLAHGLDLHRLALGRGDPAREQRQPFGPAFAVVADLARGGQVFGHLPGQVEHGGGDARGAEVDLVHRAVVLADDAGGHLPGDGRGDQAASSVPSPRAGRCR